MVVKIEEIREGGLELNEPIPEALLEQALADDLADTGFRAERGFQLQAKLSRVSGGVLLHGSFEAPLRCPCKRCLIDVHVDLPVSFDLNLIPRAELQSSRETPEDDESSPAAGSFELDQVNLEVFDGKRIDLDPILREQVLLALPISVVCREDCRGLCAVCGQNLNEEECGCERKVPDPRLSSLKDIKLN